MCTKLLAGTQELQIFQEVLLGTLALSKATQNMMIDCSCSLPPAVKHLADWLTGKILWPMARNLSSCNVAEGHAAMLPSAFMIEDRPTTNISTIAAAIMLEGALQQTD